MNTLASIAVTVIYVEVSQPHLVTHARDIEISALPGCL